MNRYALICILIPALFSACTVYKEYPIEVYKPGEVNIPPNATNAALIYRNFKYAGDTLQHYYKNDFELYKAKNDPDDLDSIMVTTCLKELAKKLKNNNSFQQIKIFPYSSFDRHSAEHLPKLPRNLVHQLTSSTGSDVLISLETFSYFFANYPKNTDTPASNEVITAAVWGIYDAAEENLLERKTFIDTVFWNGYDSQGNYQKGYRPPPRLKALEIASALVGDNYAKRFHASWQTVERMYSVPPLPDFSDAAYFFEEGKWDKAISLWKKYADDNNGKLAIYARYNLALGYEMKDNIDLAATWLNAAYDLARQYRNKDDLNMIRKYRKALDIRRKEMNRLNSGAFRWYNIPDSSFAAAPVFIADTSIFYPQGSLRPLALRMSVIGLTLSQLRCSTHCNIS